MAKLSQTGTRLRYRYYGSPQPDLCRHDVGGLGFELCVFVAGWRHALNTQKLKNSRVSGLLLFI